MKRIFLVLAICFTGLTSLKAQLAKGNLFVGSTIGSTAYNWGTNTYLYSAGNTQKLDSKQFAIDLTPSLGVFVTNHLVFGGSLDVGYSHNKSDVTNTDGSVVPTQTTINNSTYSIGPFLRYYFYNSTPSKTLLYVEGRATVGSGSGSTNELDSNTGNTTYTATDNNVFLFTAAGSLGVTHFITKNIGLDVALGYSYDYEKYTTDFTFDPNSGNTSSGSKKATLPQSGITLFAGFHFFLP